MNDVEGVWYPIRNGGLQIEQWDIANGASLMTIVMEEVDIQENIEKESTITTKYANSNYFSDLIIKSY